jgi:predicted AAA+ superfamily ATPase
MQRDLYEILCQWKRDANRRPLLVRGARQVGKTYLVNEFGRREFTSLITLNFEKNPEYKDIFNSLEPTDILEKIVLFTGKGIEPGKTLLFFDEVQDCPSAIMALRYFYEEMPSLHVIAAGSLVEFTLESENFRIPIGRIQYIYLFPMSFGEFMAALGEKELRNYICDPSKLPQLPESLHAKLNEYIRRYFILGGMPAVVQQYCTTGDMIACQRIQRAIVDTCQDDFGKYSRKLKHRYLDRVYNAVPKMVGRKFVYARVDNTIKSRELKAALELLEKAGVVKKIKRTSGAGLPLEAGAKNSFFKVLFLDVGLLHAVNGIYSDTARAKDFTTLFKGAVAEQFVGQELLAYQNPYSKPLLYYWVREAKNSSAELDYLIQKDGEVIPIEIKSGPTGRLRSMHMFMEKYQVRRGVKISQAPYGSDNQIISLPLYALEGFIRKYRDSNGNKLKPAGEMHP